MSFDDARFTRDIATRLNMPLFVAPSGKPVPGTKELLPLDMWSPAENNNYFGGTVGSAADIIPKPEDFLLVPFRLISATTVGPGSWKATEFPANILKKSMPLLKGKPVYTNHDTGNVNNAVGEVATVEWQAGYKMADGTDVPDGINGVIAIDTKIAPMLARNVLKGNVYSNSVTVEFDWVPSHDFETRWEFEDKCGLYDEDGSMIRRVVSKIWNYHESSLVFLGADPYAKKLDDQGEIVFPDYGSISYDKVGEKEKKLYTDAKKMLVSCMNQKVSFSLNTKDKGYQQQKPPSFTNNDKEMKKIFLNFLKKKLNKPDLTEEQITDEMIQSIATDLDAAPSVEEFTRLQGLEKTARKALGLSDDAPVTLEGRAVIEIGEFNALKEKAGKADKVVELEKSVQDLTVERDSFKAKAVVGEAFEKTIRDEAERLHNIVTGGKVVESTLELIKTGNIDTVKGLVETFGGQVTSQFKATCTKCASGEHITFRSSVANDHNGENNKTNTDGIVVKDSKAVWRQQPDSQY